MNLNETAKQVSAVKLCAACGKEVKDPATIHLQLGEYYVCNPFCLEFVRDGVPECKVK